MALAVTASSTGTAMAGQEPFGANIGGWSFTQEAETGGLTNCRAHITVSGQLTILAMRTNREAYVSVPAGALKGSYPDSILEFGLEMTRVLAKVHGDRLVFSPLDEGGLRLIADGGGFKWQIDKEGAKGAVKLRQTGEAVDRLIECVTVNS